MGSWSYDISALIGLFYTKVNLTIEILNNIQYKIIVKLILNKV